MASTGKRGVQDARIELLRVQDCFPIHGRIKDIAVVDFRTGG